MYNQDEQDWSFLSKQAHVLVYLSRYPRARLREIAARVGVSERAILSIVAQLERSGALRREREGRRNRYHVNEALRLAHPLESGCRISDLINAVDLDSTTAEASGQNSPIG